MDASASIYQSDITPRWQSSKRAAGGRVCRLLAGAARPLVRCPRSAETDEPMDGRRAAAPDRQWLGTRCEIVRRVPATSAHLQHLRPGPRSAVPAAQTDEPMDGRRAAAPGRQWLGTRCEIVRRVPATSAHLQHLRPGPRSAVPAAQTDEPMDGRRAAAPGRHATRRALPDSPEPPQADPARAVPRGSRWQRGQRKEDLLANLSRMIAVPHRAQGSPS